MQSLAVSYPHIAASVAESVEKDTTFSLHGSRESILSTTEFSFDQELINTKVYRELLARASAKHGKDSLTHASVSETASTKESTIKGIQVSTCTAPDQHTDGTNTTEGAQEPTSSLRPGDAAPVNNASAVESIDNLQQRDITALLDHLTVQDAQRNARDTEILVTLVRSAAEMRNSHEAAMRVLQQELEDVRSQLKKEESSTSVDKTQSGEKPGTNAQVKPEGKQNIKRSIETLAFLLGLQRRRPRRRDSPPGSYLDAQPSAVGSQLDRPESSYTSDYFLPYHSDPYEPFVPSKKHVDAAEHLYSTALYENPQTFKPPKRSNDLSNFPSASGTQSISSSKRRHSSRGRSQQRVPRSSNRSRSVDDEIRFVRKSRSQHWSSHRYTDRSRSSDRDISGAEARRSRSRSKAYDSYNLDSEFSSGSAPRPKRVSRVSYSGLAQRGKRKSSANAEAGLGVLGAGIKIVAPAEHDKDEYTMPSFPIPEQDIGPPYGEATLRDDYADASMRYPFYSTTNREWTPFSQKIQSEHSAESVPKLYETMPEEEYHEDPPLPSFDEFLRHNREQNLRDRYDNASVASPVEVEAPYSGPPLTTDNLQRLDEERKRQRKTKDRTKQPKVRKDRLNTDARGPSTSINNPKLLAAVEDAIRRKILPELEAVKDEQRRKKAELKPKLTKHEDLHVLEGPGSAGEPPRLSQSSNLPEVIRKPSVTPDDGDIGLQPSSHRKSLRYSGEPRRTDEAPRRKSSRQKSTPSTAQATSLAGAAAGYVIGGLATAAALSKHDNDPTLNGERERRKKRSKSRSATVHAYIPALSMQPNLESETTKESILSADTEFESDSPGYTKASIRKSEVRSVSHRRRNDVQELYPKEAVDLADSRSTITIATRDSAGRESSYRPPLQTVTNIVGRSTNLDEKKDVPSHPIFPGIHQIDPIARSILEPKPGETDCPEGGSISHVRDQSELQHSGVAVPVAQDSQTPGRSQIVTPRDIMRRREERKTRAEANSRAQREAERAATAPAASPLPQSPAIGVKSHYSIPEDGSPLTISTMNVERDKNKSQTSLLIEYFEGGQSKVGPTRPSVRVRLTPSSKKSKTGRDNTQITEVPRRSVASREIQLPESTIPAPSNTTKDVAEGFKSVGGPSLAGTARWEIPCHRRVTKLSDVLEDDDREKHTIVRRIPQAVPAKGFSVWTVQQDVQPIEADVEHSLTSNRTACIGETKG